MNYIKILSQEVKQVERTDGSKTLAFILQYKIWTDKWQCQVLDFEDNQYNKKKMILKLKKEIYKMIYARKQNKK